MGRVCVCVCLCVCMHAAGVVQEQVLGGYTGRCVSARRVQGLGFRAKWVWGLGPSGFGGLGLSRFGVQGEVGLGFRAK